MSSEFAKRCDVVMAYSFVAMIYFLPIAPAFIESFFGIIFLTYLIKRSYLFFSVGKFKKNFYGNFLAFIRAFKPVSNPLNMYFGYYVLIAAISIIMNDHIAVGFKGLFFKTLQGIFTYFLFVESVNTRRRLRVFSYAFLLSITLIVTNGVFQYFTKEGFVRHVPITDGRVTSSFMHANNFGGYLLIAILFTLCLTVSFKRNGFIHKEEFLSRPLVRVFLGILCVAGLLCIGLTFSRSAWLSLIVALTVLGLRRPKFFLLPAGVVVILLLYFVPLMIIDRDTIYTLDSVFSHSSRFRYWFTPMIIIRENLFFGIGLNAYSVVAADYPLPYHVDPWRGDPHNCYLQMAAEIGIFGLGVFIAMLVAFFRAVRKGLEQCVNRTSYNMLLGVSLGLVGFLIQSTLDTNFYNTKLDALMWVMMGFAMALKKVELAENSMPKD